MDVAGDVGGGIGNVAGTIGDGFTPVGKCY